MTTMTTTTMTTTTGTETMTNAQMCWMVKESYAWFGRNSDGSPADDTFDPIYSHRGQWSWYPMDGTHGGRYELDVRA